MRVPKSKGTNRACNDRAIFGALAGAFYGFEEIPPELVSTLEGREMVRNVAEQLADVVVRT